MRSSVVMPCWNAAATLPRALDALAAQALPSDAFEVIVVDDGSTDDTVVRAAAAPPGLRVRLVRQANRGIAAARNLGAAHARGDVLLFLDPDVFAQPGLLAAHLDHYTHPEQPLAVQGRTVADPEALTTPFMRTSHLLPDLTRRRRDDLSPFHVVGRNFSVTRSTFTRLGGFDEGFAGYGYEDVEFAYRFRRAGGRIRYAPEAVGVHHHVMSADAAASRQVQNGRAAVRFWLKHGRAAGLGVHLEIHPVLLPLKWLVFRTGVVTAAVRALRPWAERRRLDLVLNECYNHLLWHGYYEGVFAALGEAGRRPRPAVRQPAPDP